MHSERVPILVFDLSAEYGHFRKFNTTTSPLTYTVPTRIAIAGIMGAILGIEREVAPGRFPPGVTPVQEVFSQDNCKIGVKLCRMAKRVVVGFNLLDTKKSFFEIKSRTQIPFELLKDPWFRVYLTLKDTGIMDELTWRIREQAHHFTPYLGLSQFTAQVSYIDRIEGEACLPASDAYIPVASAVNLDQLTTDAPVQFSEHIHLLTETMPISMTRDRVITAYAEVLMEANGHLVYVRPRQWIRAGEHGNIMFL